MFIEAQYVITENEVRCHVKRRDAHAGSEHQELHRCSATAVGVIDGSVNKWAWHKASAIV